MPECSSAGILSAPEIETRLAPDDSIVDGVACFALTPANPLPVDDGHIAACAEQRVPEDAEESSTLSLFQGDGWGEVAPESIPDAESGASRTLDAVTNPTPTLPEVPKHPRPSYGGTLKSHMLHQPTRDELIMQHQKLVHYVAARFIGAGETLEDLIQVGNIGLINALDRYDSSKDVKFSTYAMPTIVGEIKRHFRDKTWQVKVPRWLQELSINARKAQQSLTVKLGRSPTVREIAAEVGATEDRTLEALEITHIASTVSLDTRLDTGAAGDSATLMDVIGKADHGLLDVDAYSDVRRAITQLDPREREVIELRFFEEMSQAKIARHLEISQMHVSRLQQRALLHLRSILADEVHRPRRGRRKSTRGDRK